MSALPPRASSQACASSSAALSPSLDGQLIQIEEVKSDNERISAVGQSAIPVSNREGSLSTQLAKLSVGKMSEINIQTIVRPAIGNLKREDFTQQLLRLASLEMDEDCKREAIKILGEMFSAVKEVAPLENFITQVLKLRIYLSGKNLSTIFALLKPLAIDPKKSGELDDVMTQAERCLELKEMKIEHVIERLLAVEQSQNRKKLVDKFLVQLPEFAGPHPASYDKAALFNSLMGPFFVESPSSDHNPQVAFAADAGAAAASAVAVSKLDARKDSTEQDLIRKANFEELFFFLSEPYKARIAIVLNKIPLEDWNLFIPPVLKGIHSKGAASSDEMTANTFEALGEVIKSALSLMPTKSHLEDRMIIYNAILGVWTKKLGHRPIEKLQQFIIYARFLITPDMQATWVDEILCYLQPMALNSDRAEELNGFLGKIGQLLAIAKDGKERYMIIKSAFSVPAEQRKVNLDLALVAVYNDQRNPNFESLIANGTTLRRIMNVLEELPLDGL